MGKQVFSTEKAISNLKGNVPEFLLGLAINSYMHLFEGKTKEEILALGGHSHKQEDLDDEDFIYMEEN